MNLQEARDNPYAWPGGYALLAVMDDGEVLCHDCLVREEEVHEGGERDGWRFEDVTVHWEGPPEQCAHCNKDLPSEYGEIEE